MATSNIDQLRMKQFFSAMQYDIQDTSTVSDAVTKITPVNSRQEIIKLLRGYAACPIISHLGEQGLLDRMLQGPFTVRNFPYATPAILDAVLRYLICLGLLVRLGQQYEATALGRTVFQRLGAFNILHSYRDYFDQIPQLLAGRGSPPTVHRLRNVLGSGQLHSRKFFPTVLRFLADALIETIVDIGCGDGHFLSSIHAAHPAASIVAVDLSEVAVNTTVKHLEGCAVRGVVADGFNVDTWATALPPSPGCTLVSAWFVLHEFSCGEPARAVEFFRRLQQHCPQADVVIGEIVNVPDEAIAAHRAESIMPEFLLFHALSGQGVLTWEQHRDVLANIPYCLIAEERFDQVPIANCDAIPSSFVWHLRPWSRTNG